MNDNVLLAKIALDSLIKKSRAHMYKPTQIAEILRKHRLDEDGVIITDLETYRSKSKKWRDEVSLRLVGNKCTSSAKFQDNLFESNAIPPNILEILAAENKKTGGAVEAYIYSSFYQKMSMVSNCIEYCSSHDQLTFQLDEFLGLFWNEPGLKRSIDKVFESVVFALFSTIVRAIEAQVSLSYNPTKKPIIEEFEEFAKSVLNISISNAVFKTSGSVHRIGATNAADRGLDIWTNFGVIVQIKHLSLTEEVAEEVCRSLTADRIVIVCKQAERAIITSLLTQIGWKSKIQSIITENMLFEWYEKALRGKYSNLLGENLLVTLVTEIQKEFPSTQNNKFDDFYRDRGYYNVPENSVWSHCTDQPFSNTP